ncbi:MAG: lytic transglycosylase domain-containing protein [Firmicutes bacterium]|mgnify:FL=1|nr:lytic transglycosylase domain-containing protein [Bacillota bacterium]
MHYRKGLFSILIIAVTAGLLNWQVFLRWFYPIEYVTEISRYTQSSSLDPYLVASIIRVESNFQPTARSPKGATGLMQLMPETAAWVAARIGLNDELDLAVPDLNIRLGCWYLDSLREEFAGNLIVALAAYNGGRGNVNRWLAEKRWDGRIETVDNIPFLETRLYVQRVLGVYSWYLRLYSGNWPPAYLTIPVLPDLSRRFALWFKKARLILR